MRTTLDECHELRDLVEALAIVERHVGGGWALSLSNIRRDIEKDLSEKVKHLPNRAGEDWRQFQWEREDPKQRATRRQRAETGRRLLGSLIG